MTATSFPRIALVTGASRGLGRNTALALAVQGTDIVLTYQHNADDAASAVEQIQSLGRRAIALQLDVGVSQGFPAFTQQLRDALATWQRERIDFLVNNAGVGVNAPFAHTTEAQFDQMVGIHLKGVFFLTQALLPLIADGGAIVNLSSGLARFAMPGYAAYAAMKAGVETLTRYLALELGPRGIRVNVVAPGAVETDFGGGAVRDNAELNAAIAAQTALGRVGLPADIGPVVASLLSPGMGWVNGQRIEAAGGIRL